MHRNGLVNTDEPTRLCASKRFGSRGLTNYPRCKAICSSRIPPSVRGILKGTEVAWIGRTEEQS